MTMSKPVGPYHLRVVMIDSQNNFKEGGNVSKAVKVMADAFDIRSQLITAVDFYNKFQVMDFDDYADALFVGFTLEGAERKGPDVVEALRAKYDCSYIVGWSENIDEVAQSFIDAGADQVISKSEAADIENLRKILDNAAKKYLQDCLEPVL